MIQSLAELGPETELGLASLACLLLAATTAAAWLVVLRIGRVEKKLAHLERLPEVQAALQKFQEDRGALDVRRLEHVLIDIRDGQKRVEDRTLAVLESAHGAARSPGAMEPASGTGASGATMATALADRIVSRLLALGYERVQLVTPLASVATFLEAGGDGDVSVEARRDGAACKGRILVRRGAIADVQLQSAYSTFP